MNFLLRVTDVRMNWYIPPLSLPFPLSQYISPFPLSLYIYLPFFLFFSLYSHTHTHTHTHTYIYIYIYSQPQRKAGYNTSSALSAVLQVWFSIFFFLNWLAYKVGSTIYPYVEENCWIHTYLKVSISVWNTGSIRLWTLVALSLFYEYISKSVTIVEAMRRHRFQLLLCRDVREGASLFPGLLYFTFHMYLEMLSVKQ